ncbi:MAG: hypothetical protein KIS62_03680 [Ramlibacter sp.]|nr:hypothetical protein [Ramlibacter sp.]
MTYTVEQVADLKAKSLQMLGSLQELQRQCVVHGQEFANDSPAREHLLHGAGRRLSVLKRSLQRIFETFPPDIERPLERELLADVQICLHAFVINLYGIFDNWAWAFVHRHGIQAQIGSRQGVSLFKASTQRYLAPQLREYLTNDLIRWHNEYLKNYRDALAHRIPLYIPPVTYTPEEGERYNALESEKIEKITAHDFARVDQIWVEQTALGRPCLEFLHSYAEEGALKPVPLHSQVISDAMTVVEFGTLYLEHWHVLQEQAGV